MFDFGSHRTHSQTECAAVSLPHGCARGALGQAPPPAGRTRTKCQTPTEGVDEQAQITGMADHAIAAEPAQYEHWPEPQPATNREEPDAEPANRIISPSSVF